METPIIQDDSPEASWFVSTAVYTCMDYSTGVRFEPRTPVRTKLTEWMKGQSAIEAYEFPKPPEEAPPEAPAKGKK